MEAVNKLICDLAADRLGSDLDLNSLMHDNLPGFLSSMNISYSGYCGIQSFETFASVMYYMLGVVFCRKQDFNEAAKWFSALSGTVADGPDYRKNSDSYHANSGCDPIIDKWFSALSGTVADGPDYRKNSDSYHANSGCDPIIDDKYNQYLASARYYLGCMYSHGVGVGQNYEMAAKLFRSAARCQHHGAENKLAEALYKGQGIEKHWLHASEMWRKAADGGNADAQNSLAGMYFRGEIVNKDYAEAAKWYRKAAEQGNVDAQKSIADMYFEGEGVERDLPEAVKWYMKAAEQGSEDARNRIEKIFGSYPKQFGITPDKAMKVCTGN